MGKILSWGTDEDEQIAFECKELHSQGKSQEELISFLRAKGCSRIVSIGILVPILGIKLRDAGPLVHFSETWSDVRKQDEALLNAKRGLQESK